MIESMLASIWGSLNSENERRGYSLVDCISHFSTDQTPLRREGVLDVMNGRRPMTMYFVFPTIPVLRASSFRTPCQTMLAPMSK